MLRNKNQQTWLFTFLVEVMLIIQMRGSFAILLPQTTVLLSFLFEVFKHKTFIGKLTKFSYIPRFDYTKKIHTR